MLVASLQCQSVQIKNIQIMKTQEQAQCPNCWGYQTYDEQNTEQQICICK